MIIKGSEEIEIVKRSRPRYDPDMTRPEGYLENPEVMDLRTSGLVFGRMQATQSYTTSAVAYLPTVEFVMGDTVFRILEICSIGYGDDCGCSIRYYSQPAMEEPEIVRSP